MQILRKYKTFSALLLIIAISGFVLLIIQIQRTQDVEESTFTALVSGTILLVVLQ